MADLTLEARQRAASPAARLPGMAAAVGIAALAWQIRPLLPPAVSEIAIAVLVGVVVANLLPVRETLGPGARFAVGRILRVGVVLLGARLALDDVVAHGLSSLLFVTATTTTILLVGAFFAQRGEPKLRLLLAAGTAICGNSAIVAVAPVLEADDRDVSVAVSTITGFGVLAVLVYPLIGRFIDMPSDAFGLWAGAAINDTSQVVAAGYAYDGLAGDAAVVTKLTRNLLLVPTLVAMGLLVARGRSEGPQGGLRLRRGLPVFVLGFVLMAAARSVGILDLTVAGRPAYELASGAASAAILVALAGVGLQTDIRAVAAVGIRPLAFGFGLGLLLALGSLAAIVGLGMLRT